MLATCSTSLTLLAIILIILMLLLIVNFFSLFCMLILYSYAAGEMGCCTASAGLQFLMFWTIVMLLHPVTIRAKYVFFPYGQISKFIFMYNNKVCVYVQRLITIAIIWSWYSYTYSRSQSTYTNCLPWNSIMCPSLSIYLHFLSFHEPVICRPMKAWVIFA